MTRRIVTAREQVEMLAPWREAATQRLAFDWQEASGQPCRTCGWNHPSQILRKAPLENGHELHAWTWNDHPGPEKLGWSWAIIDPSKYPEEPNKHSSHGEVELAGNGGDAGRQGDPGHVNFIPSFEHAKSQAEEHYKKMFPIGTSTGGHDSGVDYSDLNAFRNARRTAIQQAHPGLQLHYFPDQESVNKTYGGGEIQAPVVTAHHPDSKYQPTGWLQWDTSDHHERPNTVSWIDVDPDFRRQGIGAAMWEHAKKFNPDIKHSEQRSMEGDDWAHAVGGHLPPLMDEEDDW